MTFTFYLKNWKADAERRIQFERTFPSVYAADRYAVRISTANNSPYVVTVDYPAPAEISVDGLISGIYDAARTGKRQIKVSDFAI